MRTNPQVVTPIITSDEFIPGNNVVYFVRTRKRNNIIISKKTLTLKPISSDELLALRYVGKPGLVFKYGVSLYYADISTNTRFLLSSSLGRHLCSECNRLSALPDSKGGCRKVRNSSLSGVDLSGDTNYKERINNSKRIEKYNFINVGYETFNTSHDVFVVLKCKNHTELTSRPPISAERAYLLKKSLADFLYDNHTF